MQLKFTAVIVLPVLLSACTVLSPKSNSNHSSSNKQAVQYMSKQDTQLADYAARSALELLKTGDVKRWANPKTGNAGEVTPTSTWYDKKSKRYCRTYKETIYIKSLAKSQTFEDQACRNKRGIWSALRS